MWNLIKKIVLATLGELIVNSRGMKCEEELWGLVNIFETVIESEQGRKICISIIYFSIWSLRIFICILFKDPIILIFTIPTIIHRFSSIDKKDLNLNVEYIVEKCLEKLATKTWNQTCDSFLDTMEAFPEELNIWEKRNLKYVAYLVVAWDLLGFTRYFITTAISNVIATRRVSS